MKNFLQVNRALRAKKNFNFNFKHLLVLGIVLITCINTAWGTSVTYTVGTGSKDISDQTCTINDSPLVLKTCSIGGGRSSRTIWKDGGTNKNENTVQLSSSAGNDPSTKYIEISISEGYKITGVTVRGSCKDGGPQTYNAFCFEGDYSTEAGAVKGVASLAFYQNTCTSDQANVSMTDIADNTRTIRIYKQVKYNSSTHTIGNVTGASTTPASVSYNVNIASITVTYEAVAAACTDVAAPTGLSCTNIWSNNLTFGWTAASNADHYTATLYSDAECNTQVKQNTSISGTSTTFRDITPNTTYYCKVQSHGNGSTYCEDGGTTATAASAKTLEARIFKSGEYVYFKDASGPLPFSGGEAYWKQDGGDLCAYFFDDASPTKNSAWATALTKVSGSNWNEKNNIYRIIVPQLDSEDHEWTGVIFTRGAAGSAWTFDAPNFWEQTEDQRPALSYNLFKINNDAADGKWRGTWARYTENPTLVGDFNNWEPTANVFGNYSSNVGSTMFTLDAASTNYKFKILDGEKEWSYDASSAGWTITNTTTTSQQLYDNNDVSNITSTEVGEYVMKYNKSTHTFIAAYYPKDRLTKSTILYFDGRRETNWKAAPYHTKFYFKKHDSDSELEVSPSYWFGESTVDNSDDNWVYYITLPNSDNIGKVQLMRMDPSNHASQWCYSNMVSVGTRTSVIQNCLTEQVGGEDWKDTWVPGWTIYCPPTTSETFTDNSTSVIAGTSGDGTSENPYLVPTTGNIKVQASASKAVADGNMTINYDFKVDDSSAQPGEGNTYSKGSLSNNTTYKMSVDVYTVYNLDDSENSTKHTPTELYYKALNVYTISYNKGSNGTGDNTTAEKIYDISKTLLGVTFTRTGYTQTAWNTDPSGTGGTSYSLSGSYTGNADVMLYPTWTANPISVTLAKGTNGAANQAATINYDATTCASFTAVSGNTGYRCTGYYDGETQVLNADGSFAAANVTGYITSGKWTKASNCTLTAHWTEQSYSITYKDGGNTEFSGTHETGYPTSHTYGSATALKKATKTGYAFAGWYATSTCTGDAVTSLGATDYDDDIILYARWVELDLHEPGVYEAPTSEGGYGRVLKHATVNAEEHDYEVYLFTIENSNGSIYAGPKTSISDGKAMFTEVAANTEAQPSDTWFSFKADSYAGDEATVRVDEFSQLTSATAIGDSRYAVFKASSYLRLRVSGYSEFAFIGRDNSIDNSRLFCVRIDGVTQDYTHNVTDKTVFRFDLGDTGEHFIEITTTTNNSNRFRGFSLRLPDVTRYTVSATNTDGYGSVDVTSISNVRSGSTIYTSSNTLTVGGTTVTATENSSTAQYSYAFNNWTKGDGTALPGTVTGAITVRANFTQTPVNYTLAWNANGGDALSGTYTSGSTGYGTAITAPNDPTRDGYTFTVWNSASNGSGDDYTGSMPAANTTYYAQWTKLYASGTYQFDGNLTVGTSPNKTVTTSEVSYDAFRIDNLFFSGSKIQFEGTDGTPQGDGDNYMGWKMKTNNSTIKFFVEYDSDVEVSIGGIGSSSSCKISYTDQSSVDHSNTSISAGTNPSYEVKAGTMVTITFTVDEGNKKSVTLKRIAISETAACTNPSASLSDGAYEVLGTALDLRTLWSSSNTTDGVTFTVTNAGGTNGTIAGDGYSFSASAAGSATIRAVQTSTGAYCDADETATITVTMPTYDVTLNTNGGTVKADNVTSYTYGTGATLPTDVTKSGYLFQGWYDNSGFSGDAVTTISSSATGNKTFYAKWYELAEKCETTNSTFADAVWNDNYVNGIRYDIEGTDGDQFEMGDGHYFRLFIGDLGTIKEIKLTITAVGTISASTGIDYDFLESNEYVYYDFGDHTEDVTAERSLSIGTLSLRPTSGENNDFVFKTNGTTLTISNICIYYEPAYFTVTYNANGGSSAPSDDTGTDITLNSGSGMTGPSGRTTFMGWNTQADGYGTGYAGGTTDINADLDLYAIWGNTYSTGHVFAHDDSYRIVNGVRKNPAAGAVVTTDGTATTISSGSSILKSSVTGLTDVTISGCTSEYKTSYPWLASYIKIPTGQTLTFTVASGYIGTATIYYSGYNKTTTLTNGANSQSITSDATNPESAEGNFTSKTFNLVTGTNTFTCSVNNGYISRIEVSMTQLYTLTLDKNNSDASGSTSGSAYVSPNGTTFQSGFTAPTRSGYAVTGYYAEAECTTLVADAEGNLKKSVEVDATNWTDEDGKWIKGSDATLYAKWGVVYTVTFNTNGGSSVDAITQTSEGAPITMPAAPTKSGYTFNGWQIGSTYAAGASYTPTANVTAYATWKAECGVIKWDFTNYTDKDISLTEGRTTSYTANDGETEMRYTAGGSEKIFAPSGGTPGYLKENGKTSSGSYTDLDGTTPIGNARLIRLFVEAGSGTLRINCNGTNGVYKVLDGSASGTTLISSLSANTTSSSITLTTSPLWIETTTKGYINDIRWTPSSTVCYYVTYNGNGADGGYVNDPEAHSSGDNVTTLANNFTRTGCTFTGWNTATDGSGTAYVAGGTISSISGNVTLYAQWKITVSENKNLSEYTSDALSTTDVVVTNGATLIVTEDTEVRNITVETGSTLNINTTNGDGTGSGVTFTANSLSLKGGLNSSGTKYNMPRVYIDPASSIVRTNSTINFDISVDQRNYYPIAVPFPVTVSDVDYVNSTMAYYSVYGKHYVIKEYDGAGRAENGAVDENWKVVEDGDKYGESSATLQPGKGYILTAISKPAYGGGVIRFPMNVDNAWLTGGEQATVSAVTKNTVAVKAYTGKATGGGKNSNKGWNMLGVPYMSCFASKGNYAHDAEGGFTKGKLNFITGEYTETSNVYVTVPTSDFSEYLQFNFDDADTKLLPGWCFFVQVDKDGTIMFEDEGQTNSSSLPIYAPKREQEMPTVKTGIILSSETASDKTTILVSDKYSVTDYEINADLEKMFGNGYTLATYSLAGTTRLAYNAMSNSDAMNVIPIGYRAPADGEYTFAINPRYAENGAFEHVNLIDYETGFVTDLLLSSYSFATERTQNDERFALNVVKAPQTATDITVTGDGLQVTGPQKVIINDKLYIIVDGRMYSAEGALVK